LKWRATMIIRDLVLIFSVLFAVCVAVAGSRAMRDLQLAFAREVDVLPPYPIVLKPYPGLIFLYALAGAMFIAFAVFGVALSRDDIGALMIFSLPSLLIALVFLASAYMYSQERIVLEVDKLIFKKSHKDIVVHFSDIIGFSVVIGYLNIKKKSDGSTAKILLYFKDIRYLNAVLEKWFTRKIL